LIISGPVPQGDRHEFNELKPKIENLVSLQRQLANGFYLKQKNYLKKEKLKKAESCFATEAYLKTKL
jgi:preprotein translocase subunit SecA